MRGLITLILTIPLVLMVSQVPSSLPGDIVLHGAAARVALANGTLEDLVSPVDAYGIALDVHAGKMYWTGPINGKIQRANLDGTDLEDTLLIINSPDFDAVPVGIALDLLGGKMYWVARNQCDPPTCGTVQRANIQDSSSVETLVQGVELPGAVALDVPQGKMYWTATNEGKIRRANLDGTDAEDVRTDLPSPEGIALDLGDGKVYWTEPAAGKVRRANLNGTGLDDLIFGLNEPTGIALDLTLGKVYWTNFSDGKVQRANLDGSGVRDVITGLDLPTGIALDLTGGKMYLVGFGGKIQRADIPTASCP